MWAQNRQAFCPTGVKRLYLTQKEQILIEIILLLIKTGRYREALDEIDLQVD
jgi:hypothetical protein